MKLKFMNLPVKKEKQILILCSILFISLRLSSQGFLITAPKLEFENNLLHISYDLVSTSQHDQFYVWVEITDQNDNYFKIKALSGDQGEKITTGSGKKIVWSPEKDSIFLNEMIFVEIKAEKYVKSFNKVEAFVLSAVLPGLGQSKISKGKPWWITGVATYGVIATGIIVHKKYINTYESYRIEEDPYKRTDLLNSSQQQLRLSSTLIISGIACYATNLIWISIKPNKFKPLKYSNLTLNKSVGQYYNPTLLSLEINF